MCIWAENRVSVSVKNTQAINISTTVHDEELHVVIIYSSISYQARLRSYQWTIPEFRMCEQVKLFRCFGNTIAFIKMDLILKSSKCVNLQVSGNWASNCGGGIYVDSGSLTMTNSTVTIVC